MIQCTYPYSSAHENILWTQEPLKKIQDRRLWRHKQLSCTFCTFQAGQLTHHHLIVISHSCLHCCVHVFVGEPDAQAVAAPVNEDLNDEDDEAVEENALAESAAVEKKAAKAAAKQQKVAWIGSSQPSADNKHMYMCAMHYSPTHLLSSYHCCQDGTGLCIEWLTSVDQFSVFSLMCTS